MVAVILVLFAPLVVVLLVGFGFAWRPEQFRADRVRRESLRVLDAQRVEVAGWGW